MKNSTKIFLLRMPNIIHISLWLMLLFALLTAVVQSVSAKTIDNEMAIQLDQTTQTIGNEPIDGSFTDAHNPSIFINEEDTFTNAGGAPLTINIENFSFYAKREGNPVTPLVVRVNADNEFTVLAIGKTYTNNDYSTGVNTVPFADIPQTLVLASGETIAAGFMDSNPDGTGWGVGGNPIPAGANQSVGGGSGQDQDEVWLLSPSPLIAFGNGYNANADTPTAVVGEEILTTNSGKSLTGYTQLLRSYSFGISFTSSNEPTINNGSFENNGLGNGQTNLAGWLVTSGSVDILNGSAAANGSAANGSQFLDLANGTIEQTISGFTPNQPYVIRIDYQGNTADDALKEAQIIVDGQALSQGLFGGDPPGIHSKEENNWVVCNGFEFTPVTSTVTLKIDSGESGSNGLFIDNVRIVSGSIAQPPEHDFNSLTTDNDGWRPLVNGSFEDSIATHTSNPENTGPDDNNPHLCGDAIPGWRVTRENTDRINGWNNTPDGSKVLDPGGHGPGGIAQTITGLAPNSSYQLEFFAARHRFWGTNLMTTEVWANGQQELVFTRNSNQTADDGYIREVVDLTSDSNGKITFEIFSANAELGGNNVIDNFRMRAVGAPATSTPTPTPEPTPDDWTFNNGGGYVTGTDSQISVPGTGTNWSAQFWRKDGNTFGSGNRASFDFYVDQKGSKTYLSIIKDGGSYERFALVDNGGGLNVNIYRPSEAVPSFTQQILSATEFQANTWYSASITIDDQYGSFITVEQRDDPSISGEFRDTAGLLSTGSQWKFFGLLFQHTVFLDNYLEEAVPLAPPPADDWIFKNNSGGYVPGSEPQIQVNGTGTNWNAQFLRKDGSTFGSGNRVSFDFYVDQKNSRSYLSIVKEGGSFERFALVDNGNGLSVNIYRPAETVPNSSQQILSDTEFQANTWYSASITVDDQYGSFIRVEQRDDPNISGEFRDTAGLLSTGSQWSFFGLIYQHSVFLDNYLEEVITLTPPIADDWIFRNNSGGYVPGSEPQIQVTGTGTNWNSQFLRTGGSTFGSGTQVSFDFYVDQKDSKTHLSLVKEGGSFERFSLIDIGGGLRVNIYRPDEAVPSFTQELLSDTQFQSNTWYSASITVDDEYGSFIRVAQRDNSSISGEFRDSDRLLATDSQWSFFGLIYQHSVFLDNYLEEVITLTPPIADDWIFRNDSGSYVPGSETQIQVNGTGTNWNAQFLRKDGSTFGSGNQVTFDFYVDQKNSKAHLSLVKEGGSYERLALIDNGGSLKANVYRPSEAAPYVTQELLSAAEFQDNTWYSVTMTIDDTNGSMIQVEQRDNPAINGSYQDTTGLLSTGSEWSFFGIMFQNSIFIDHFAESSIQN